ncbi:EAL domain-containing protein [Roseateles sp. DAIF2]|uniref:putative bifunctional diguanylate cyclase/phosphodiesterase n=1 Tax=Roseateles sp. DAIF2 TaxID=2714952 RepID=UPI0018A31F5B|nr:bifunctional diguanylate cyclase/phosphodiesterase [Roseateles sp. DAIF2]QPF72407.1 EAL domain-containing protein [Roseateles sp. DAIF2]
MIYALAFNLLVNLVLGLALWRVWVRDREQGFTRLLGASFLVHVLATPAYLLWLQPAPLPHGLGGAGMAAAGAAAMTLLVLGLRELTGRPLARREAALLGLVLLGLFAALIAQGIEVAQAAGAGLQTWLGLVALRWLWGLGRAERFAGLLLLLLGLSQFPYALGGAEWLPLQTSIGAGLRLMLGISLMLAALRHANVESHRLREQLHFLTENSHQGVGIKRGRHILYANAALLRLYGVPDLAAFEALQREQPEALRHSTAQRHRAVLTGRLPHAQWEGERRRSDGGTMRLVFSSWRVSWNGRAAEHIVVSDDTDRFLAAQALLHQATHDPLSGLPNRSALQRRLRELCGAGRAFGLVWLDLDRFTQLNDAYGHGIGDALLRQMARLLCTEFPAPRVEVMHLGEDEFALLLPGDARPEALRALTQRLRLRLTRPVQAAGHEIYLDVSMGVASFPATADDADGLMREASAAMHEAKQDPGTAERWAQASARRSSATMLAEQAMRAGLKNAEFQLLYQPKVAAEGGALLSFEALVRWHRPGHGIVSPVEFIPAAERTGLILPLGAMLLEQACRQQAIWRALGGPLVPVAVNVSPLQLQDPAFPDFVLSTLQAFELPPALLSLEVTETAAVRDAEQAQERLARLKALGIKVALDDFGTGFSSLNLLRNLPLDAVKIDRSLIEPMPQPAASAVVRSICQLAAALRLQVVAEGIETEAQAAAARAAGCQALQGYLFAKPLLPAEAGSWLRRMEEDEQAGAELSPS